MKTLNYSIEINTGSGWGFLSDHENIIEALRCTEELQVSFGTQNVFLWDNATTCEVTPPSLDEELRDLLSGCTF